MHQHDDDEYSDGSCGADDARDGNKRAKNRDNDGHEDGNEGQTDGSARRRESLSADKRSGKRLRENDAAHNERLKARVDVLNSENAKLQQEVSIVKQERDELVCSANDLRTDLESSQLRVQQLSKAVVSFALSPVPSLSRTGAMKNGVRKIVMVQVIQTPNGRPLSEVKVPFRFQDNGAFPHAVDTNLRTNLREYQIEQRRPVNLVFVTQFEDDGTPATEDDITESGLVRYRFRVVYADTQENVKAQHFTKTRIASITTPREDVVAARNLVNGELSYRIKFNASSSDTAPARHRMFQLVVEPEDPELARNGGLTVFTPAFTVRGKVTPARPPSHDP